jgi:hypothetical protein
MEKTFAMMMIWNSLPIRKIKANIKSKLKSFSSIRIIEYILARWAIRIKRFKNRFMTEKGKLIARRRMAKKCISSKSKREIGL